MATIASTSSFVAASTNWIDQSLSIRAYPIFLLGFLGRKDLAATYAVSCLWRRCVTENQNMLWKNQYRTLLPGLTAEQLPEGDNYREKYKGIYKQVISKEFYLEFFGSHIGPVPSIPAHFLTDAAHLAKGELLMVFPEFLPLEVDAADPLGLDQEGNLTEDLSKRTLSDAFNGKKTLKVPMTITNMIFLVKNRLKKGDPIDFGALLDAINSINARKPLRWSAQKRQLRRINWQVSMDEQKASIEQKGLGIVDAPDRFFFNVVRMLRNESFAFVSERHLTSNIEMGGYLRYIIKRWVVDCCDTHSPPRVIELCLDPDDRSRSSDLNCGFPLEIPKTSGITD